jgi:hypothetical protein
MRSPSDDALGPGFRAGGVGVRRARIVAGVEPVRAPLLDVPRHVQRSAPACAVREHADGKGGAPRPAVRSGAEDCIVPVVPPGPAPALGSARGVLPLGLGGQSHAEVLAVGLGVLPVHAHDRMVLRLVALWEDRACSLAELAVLGVGDLALAQPEATGDRYQVGRLLARHPVRPPRETPPDHILEFLIGATHRELTFRHPHVLAAVRPDDLVLDRGPRALPGLGVRSELRLDRGGRRLRQRRHPPADLHLHDVPLHREARAPIPGAHDQDLALTQR